MEPASASDPWLCPKGCGSQLAFRARLLLPGRLKTGESRRAYCSTCPAAYMIQANGDGSLSIGDETCRHELIRQESDDLVCVDRSCEFAAHADLVTSCCLTNPTEDGQACSQCGTACDVGLTPNEHAILATVGELLAGNARELSPSAGPEAWEGLYRLLQRLGVGANHLPTPSQE